MKHPMAWAAVAWMAAAASGQAPLRFMFPDDACKPPCQTISAQIDGEPLDVIVEANRQVPLIAVADFAHTRPEDHARLRSLISRLAADRGQNLRIFATGPSRDGAMPLYDLSVERAGAVLLAEAHPEAALGTDREIANSHGLGEYVPAPRLLRSLAIECERTGPAVVYWFAGGYGWTGEGWRSRQTGRGPKPEVVYGSLARLGLVILPVLMDSQEAETAKRLAGPLGGHVVPLSELETSLRAVRKWRMASAPLPGAGKVLGRLTVVEQERPLLLGKAELPDLGFGHTLIQVGTPLSGPVTIGPDSYLQAEVRHLPEGSEVRVELERMMEGRRHLHQRFRVQVDGGRIRLGPVSLNAEEGFRVLVFHEPSGWMGTAEVGGR